MSASVLFTLIAVITAGTDPVSRGEGVAFVDAASLSGDGAARACNAAVDRAVADAVHSFLDGFLSPRAQAEAGERIRLRLDERPEQFVPHVKVLSLDAGERGAQAEVETRISLAALRGVLQEFVPPRSLLLAVEEEGVPGGRGEHVAATRIGAQLARLEHGFTLIDPGELDGLFTRRPELRRTLGGEREASELGLRVLAQLVCVGRVRAGTAKTPIQGVFVGTGEADLRVIDCRTARVVASIAVDFRDRVPAAESEALARARAELYRRVAVELVARVPARAARGLHVGCDLGPIYAALIRSYAERPFGEIRVRNTGDAPVGPLKLQVAFDEPLLLEPFLVDIPVLSPGGEQEIPVRAALAARLITLGGTEVSAQVSVRCPGGETYDEVNRAVLVHGVNTFSWREPDAVAAYVDPDDRAVAQILAAAWRGYGAGEVPTPELARAAAMYGALAALGLRYREDTPGPQANLSRRLIHDRVSFPGQTLAEGAGDCDDLVVLFCALAEAAGLRAGVVVEADHVLAVVDSGWAPSALLEDVFGRDGLVVRDGTVWWPIETTALARGASFLSAWRQAWPAAARLARGESRLVVVRDAWKTWAPAARGRDSVADAVRVGDVGARVAREVESLREHVVAQLDRYTSSGNGGGDARVLAAVGKLYAVCGLMDEARRTLERALDEQDSFAVHYRLGEVLLLAPDSERNLRAAVDAFNAALARVPAGDLPARADTLLRLALAHRFAGELDAERAALAGASAIDPGLEARYDGLFRSPVRGSAMGPAVRRFLLEGLK